MKQMNFRRSLFLLLAFFSFLLAIDLLVLDSVVLSLMRKAISEACLGETLPILNQIFRSVVAKAEGICASDYQDKIFYAYKTLTVPLLGLAIGLTALAWHIMRHQTVKDALQITPRRLASVMLWILVMAFLVYVQLGSYVRFMADDYCMAAETVNRGVIGATIFWYQTLISRFSTNLLLSIEGALGPQFVPFYPALSLFGLIAATTYAVYQVAVPRTGRARLILSLLLSSAVVFATLQTSLDLPQSLYWAAQAANMLPPLILLAVCAGFLLKHTNEEHNSSRDGRAWLVAAAFLTFVAGGFSEAFTVMQVGLWTLTLLTTLVIRQPAASTRIRRLAAAFLFGSLVALTLHLTAPGFEGRLTRDYSTIERSVLSAFPVAIATTWEWLKWTFLSAQRILSLLALLLVFALASVRFFESRLRSIDPLRLGWRTLILLLPVTFVLLYACFLPGAYSTGGPPPGRHLIIPAYVLSIAVALAGIILGQWLTENARVNKEQFFKTVGLVVLALVLVTSIQAMRGQLRLLRGFARYQEAWDANEIVIREAFEQGADSVIITALPGPWWNVTNRDIGPDPEARTNECASRYYGIEVTAYE
jgi:hypothetical protein